MFISSHHLIIVIQPEVYLDHLLQGLEPPLTLLTVLQVQNTLETLQSSLNRYRYNYSYTDTDTGTRIGTVSGTQTQIQKYRNTEVLIHRYKYTQTDTDIYIYKLNLYIDYNCFPGIYSSH